MGDRACPDRCESRARRLCNGSGIGLGRGGTAVTGLGTAVTIVTTAALTLALAGCRSENISNFTSATFETDLHAPVIGFPNIRSGGAPKPTTAWATIRLQADWNDLEAALEVAQTEAETAVIREIKSAVQASTAAGTPLPSFRRTFELLSISGETGLVIAEAERISPLEKTGGSHQIVLRAQLHSATAPNRDRAAKFVEAMAKRLERLAGIDAAAIP